jgi:hypothetical protein
VKRAGRIVLAFGATLVVHGAPALAARTTLVCSDRDNSVFEVTIDFDTHKVSKTYIRVGKDDTNAAKREYTGVDAVIDGDTVIVTATSKREIVSAHIALTARHYYETRKLNTTRIDIHAQTEDDYCTAKDNGPIS